MSPVLVFLFPPQPFVELGRDFHAAPRQPRTHKVETTLSHCCSLSMTSTTMHRKRRVLLDSHHHKHRFLESKGAGSHRDEYSLPALRQETESSNESTASSEDFTTSNDSRLGDDSRSLTSFVLASSPHEKESSNESTIYEETNSSDDNRSLSKTESTNEAFSEESSLYDDSHSRPSSVVAASLRSDESQHTRKRCKAETVSRVAPSVPPMHLLPRLFKPNRQWLFRVGEHADKRSHGTAETASIRWRTRDFEILDKLGCGKFGGISLAVDNGIYVALKRITKEHVREVGAVKHVRHEVEIQTQLRHEHILQSFGYFQCPNSVTLVLEYAEYGNLNEYRKNEENDTLSIPKTAHFLRQIVSAVGYLESLHVAHRDIKPENIVLTTRSTAKLCDFGYSIQSPPRDVRTTLCGTPEFIPPEMLTKSIEYAACHVDPWALGVLAYELVNGNSPFFVKKSEKDRMAAKKGYNIDYRVNFDRIRAFSTLEIPSGDTDHDHGIFYDFCSSLLQRKPSDRMSAKDALNHPFLLSFSVKQLASHRRKRFQSRPRNRSKTWTRTH